MVARCFCHEIDHLDDHMFDELCDKLYTMEEVKRCSRTPKKGPEGAGSEGGGVMHRIHGHSEFAVPS